MTKRAMLLADGDAQARGGRMMTFELGPGLKVDLPKLIDSRLLLQANSGGGKSWALRRLLEQTHGKVQQLVIDPEGEFATPVQ